MGNISSRPRSIAKERTSFEKSEYPENEPIGPTMPKPGPILLKQAATAEKFVSKSKGASSKDNNRKIKKANSTIYVLDKAIVPSVLVECGFLSNAEETEKLCDKEYRRDIATVLVMAIDDYISSLSEENKANK